MSAHGHKKRSFKAMAFKFGIRDLLNPPKKILKEINIQKGTSVLDFGAGTGSFSLAAAKITGPGGRVFALDIHPEAIEMIEKKAKKVNNLKTINSNCETGLPDESIDYVIMYDVFHHLDAPSKVLAEMNRILKINGKMTFSDHHMDDESIRKGVMGSNLFDFLERGNKTYTFRKI